MLVNDALKQLNRLLPLKQRQQALPAPLQRLHQHILHSLVSEARVLGLADIKTWITDSDPHQALKVLAAADLVVLDSSGKTLVGAYPMTLEETPHHLTVNDQHINAMCALDAVSVAPMFNAKVEIHSRCHVTDTEVFICQQGMDVLASPSPVTGRRGLQIGIRWQDTGDCAAHSLCREMVFLKDETTALMWQQETDDGSDIFALSEAIEMGSAFFSPLLKNNET